MRRQLMVGAIFAMAGLAGCSTTEGQHSTDEFVAREMSKRGVESSGGKTSPAPDRSLAAPSS